MIDRTELDTLITAEMDGRWGHLEPDLELPESPESERSPRIRILRAYYFQ